MLIKLTNTINSIVRKGLSVIRNGLKLWLPFENSEILGEDVVVNGDFALDSDWTEGTGWDIDVVNNKATCDGTQSVSYLSQTGIVNLTSTYKVEFTVSGSTSGTLNFLKGNGSTAINVTSNDTYTYYTKWDGSTGDVVFQSFNFVGSIDNVSVQEVTQIAPDKSGNSNNATLYTGKALSFDGVNDYIDLDGFQMSGSNTTLAFWINPDDINNSSIDAIFDVNDDRFLIGFENSELSIFQITSAGVWTTFGTISNNVWQRVVITISGTTAICYRNGVQLGTTKTLPQSVDWSNAANVRIGSMYDGSASGFYDGELSDFQIYNTAWTQADVTFDYDNPQHLVTDRAASSIALSNLKGYWHLSEGAGAINYDSSGEGNNGAISGATWVPRQATIPQLALMDWSKGSNMITYSEDFSEWISSSNVTITDNVVISPEGSQNAGLINFTSGSNYFQNNGSAIVSGNTYTISCYVKRALSTNQVFTLYGNNNKTSGSLTATSEWQRLTHTFTADSTNFASGISTSAACQIYLYGFQVEAGSSPSAYRKTNGTGVTDVTLIAEPNNPSEDILVNSVRLREHSLNLDGSGYAKVDSDSSLDIANYSIDGWFYSTNNSGTWEAILTKHTQSNFEVYIRNSKILYFNDSGGGEKILASISLNAWTYFCITESGGTLKCYINDDSTPKFNGTVTPRFATSGHIYIGSKSAGGDYSNALIDDIRVYNGVLSADEVGQNYKAGLNQHKTGSSFSDDFSSDYGF